MRNDRSRARALALCAVLAIHAALLWLLVESSTAVGARERHAAPLTRIALRLIAAPAPAVPAPLVVGRSVRSDRPKAPSRPAVQPNPTSAPPHPGDTAAFAEPRREEAASRTEPAASAGSPLPALLDTEATRRAIRASAREASLGDQLARARDEPGRDGPQARLANDMQAAGKGDCLRGEFAGGGMGLLSLPFLLIAGARGDCAK